MKLLKKSMLLCICVALLATTMFTSCDLLENIQGVVEEPAQKECDHDPYKITTHEGIAYISFDPCYTKPFVLEIPETDEEGNPITEIRCDASSAMLPFLVSEEDFAVFQGKLEEYYGITCEEALEISRDGTHPKYEAAFWLFKYMSYFIHMDLDDCKSDRQRQDMLEAYPITEKMDIYVFDTNASMKDILRIYAVARKAAPELDDVWYMEAYQRAEFTMLDSSGMPETMTEIRWPSQLSAIPDTAFAGCDGMETVTIPETVSEVGTGAFAGCDALQEVIFSEGVTNIYDFALFDCPQIKTVHLPASLESLGFLFDTALLGDESEQELPTIHYAGTMAQWEELPGVVIDPEDRESGLYAYFDIHCSDGVVEATLTRQ